jgi:hypothetical protein
MHINSRFVAAAFGGFFLILCKFLPNSLEPGWFCTLALKSKLPDFLQKSFLDLQHVISSLNRWEKTGIRTTWARAGVSRRFHFMWEGSRLIARNSHERSIAENLSRSWSPRCCSMFL